MAGGAGNEFVGQKQNPQGVAVGPRILGSLFVPAAMGIAYEATNGTIWQLRLAADVNGNTLFDENGQPTIELIQVGV